MMITKMRLLRKPKLSYKTPAIDGPTKAPRANVEVHSPETNPYVDKLFGKPWRLSEIFKKYFFIYFIQTYIWSIGSYLMITDE